jgi:hypothetical protein
LFSMSVIFLSIAVSWLFWHSEVSRLRAPHNIDAWR